MPTNISLQHMGNFILFPTGTTTLGYFGASIAGTSAAAAVGSVGAAIGVGALGAAAVYLPCMLLKQLLDDLDLLNGVVEAAIGLAAFIGSPAVGAILLGVAVQPALICAGIGCLMYVFLSGLSAYLSDNNSPDALIPSVPGLPGSDWTADPVDPAGIIYYPS